MGEGVGMSNISYHCNEKHVSGPRDKIRGMGMGETEIYNVMVYTV